MIITSFKGVFRRIIFNEAIFFRIWNFLEIFEIGCQNIGSVAATHHTLASILHRSSEMPYSAHWRRYCCCITGYEESSNESICYRAKWSWDTGIQGGTRFEAVHYQVNEIVDPDFQNVTVNEERNGAMTFSYLTWTTFGFNMAAKQTLRPKKQ